MISTLEAAQRNWRVAVQSSSHAGILAAVRAGTAVTTMAAGTAPIGLTEVAGDDRLPGLEPVPLYLLSHGESAGTAIRRFEDLLLEGLETVVATAQAVNAAP